MNKRISITNLNKIRENLIAYTCETLEEVNVQKLGFIRLTYGVIMQAIEDLYSGNISLAYEAGQYFKSYGYTYDCKLMNIDVELMSFIVLNPDKYLENMYDYSSIGKTADEINWDGVF